MKNVLKLLALLLFTNSCTLLQANAGQNGADIPSPSINATSTFFGTSRSIASVIGVALAVGASYFLVQKAYAHWNYYWKNYNTGNARTTPLITAATNGHFNIVRTLVEQDHADVNTCDNTGKSPLMWACQNGHTNIVEYLINKGANVRAVDATGLSAQYYAQHAPHEGVKDFFNAYYKDLYDHCKDCVDARAVKTIEIGNLRFENWTNLMDAVRNKNLPAAEQLIKNGANVNAQTSTGYTPLICAADTAQPEMVKLLLTSKADPNLKTPSGFALSYGGALNFPEITTLLIAAKADTNMIIVKGDETSSALSGAASQGWLDTVQVLVEQGHANINQCNLKGRSPLLQAIENRHAKVIDYLIDAKADGHVKYDKGETALALCASLGLHSLVKKLIAAKAHIDDGNDSGETSLMKAVIAGQAATARVLLEHNANIDAQDNTGKTVLAHAIQGKKQNVIDVLHEYKNKMNLHLLSDNTEVSQVLKDCAQSERPRLPEKSSDEEKENMSIHSSSSSTINTENTEEVD